MNDNHNDPSQCQCTTHASIDGMPSGPGKPTQRRRLLAIGTILLSGLAAAAAGLPVLGFLFAPLRKRKDEWVDAGLASKFGVGETLLVNVTNPLGTVDDGDTGKTAMYVRNLGNNQFKIFAVNCTHLGCPIQWFSGAGLFMCPCHGGVYYGDGSRASGPPPRGLFEYEHKVDRGKLLVKLGHLPTLQQPA
ncbi:MAG: Rieske 2Fe-2S domain-containing protein [Planctomycetales bacterium]|nr:Rieske 2Fe-2S domain-containing protein [Planctomycetales bacterium]